MSQAVYRLRVSQARKKKKEKESGNTLRGLRELLPGYLVWSGYTGKSFFCAADASLPAPPIEFRLHTGEKVKPIVSTQCVMKPEGVVIKDLITSSLLSVSVRVDRSRPVKKPGDTFSCIFSIYNRKDTRLFIRYMDCITTTENIALKVKKKRPFSVHPNQTHNVSIKVKIPSDYKETRWQTPILMLKLGRREDNNLKHYIRMKTTEIILDNPNAYPVVIEDEEDEREDGSKVWDGLPRKLIAATPISGAGKKHLHTPLDTKFVRDIKRYEMPDKYKSQILNKDIDSDVTFEGDPWGRRNNEARKEQAHELLFLEEAHTIQKLQRYNLGGIGLEFYEINVLGGDDIKVEELSAAGECLLTVHVTGLEEQRPSVLRNDVVIIWEQGTCDIEYEGRVAHVKAQEMILLVSNVFLKKYRAKIDRFGFNVRFTTSRMHWRSLHRAVEFGNFDYLLPTGTSPATPKPKPMFYRSVDDIAWNNGSLNPEQQQAVLNTLNFQYRGFPYLLLGPFGCGKTTTICESIIQALNKNKEARILVCSQSNASADVLALALVHSGVPSQTLYRACSPYTTIINYELKNGGYTSWKQEERLFGILDLHELQSKRIIVTTCHFASTLYGIGMSSFSHIVIDEAGQLNVMEAMLPLCMANEDTNILLSGDFHQLGPRFHSKKAQVFKIDLSPLEELYKGYSTYRGPGSENFVTKLIAQHRCPAQIARFPFENFYGDYECTGRWRFPSHLRQTPEPFTGFCLAVGIPKFYPVIFCDFRGVNIQERDSVSLVNPPERLYLVELVTTFATKMNQTQGLNPNQICVICEQYKQRKRIITQLRHANFGDIYVGSVSALQGKEFPYVFVATVTVRGPEDFQNGRARNSFWQSEKKLNTAMTRSSKLVCIIGDSKTLLQDQHWQKLVTFCKQQQSYTNVDATEYFKKAEYILNGPLVTPIESHPRRLDTISRSQFPRLWEPSSSPVPQVATVKPTRESASKQGMQKSKAPTTVTRKVPRKKVVVSDTACAQKQGVLEPGDVEELIPGVAVVCNTFKVRWVSICNKSSNSLVIRVDDATIPHFAKTVPVPTCTTYSATVLGTAHYDFVYFHFATTSLQKQSIVANELRIDCSA